MFLISDEQIDRMLSRGPRNMLAGIAIIIVVCCLPPDWKVGAVTGLMIFLLGLYGWGMRRRRAEPGIWMLGALAAVLQGICWGLFEYEHLAQVLKPLIGKGAGVRPAGHLRERIMLTVDFTLALIIYGYTVRFWATIAVRNWQLTRGSRRQRKDESEAANTARALPDKVDLFEHPPIDQLIETFAAKLGLRYVLPEKHFIGLWRGTGIDTWIDNRSLCFYFLSPTARFSADAVLDRSIAFPHLAAAGIPHDWVSWPWIADSKWES